MNKGDPPRPSMLNRMLPSKTNNPYGNNAKNNNSYDDNAKSNNSYVNNSQNRSAVVNGPLPHPPILYLAYSNSRIDANEPENNPYDKNNEDWTYKLSPYNYPLNRWFYVDDKQINGPYKVISVDDANKKVIFRLNIAENLPVDLNNSNPDTKRYWYYYQTDFHNPDSLDNQPGFGLSRDAALVDFTQKDNNIKAAKKTADDAKVAAAAKVKADKNAKLDADGPFIVSTQPNINNIYALFNGKIIEVEPITDDSVQQFTNMPDIGRRYSFDGKVKRIQDFIDYVSIHDIGPDENNKTLVRDGKFHFYYVWKDDENRKFRLRGPYIVKQIAQHEIRTSLGSDWYWSMQLESPKNPGGNWDFKMGQLGESWFMVDVSTKVFLTEEMAEEEKKQSPSNSEPVASSESGVASDPSVASNGGGKSSRRKRKSRKTKRRSKLRSKRRR